jgi:ABC-type branched-subunit amino acid transport system substrate-binding protein
MIRRYVALLLIPVLGLAACEPGSDGEGEPSASPSPTVTEAGGDRPTFKIGLVGSMAGPVAWRGEDAYEGADLGVHQVNRTMAEGQRRYELEVLDDGGGADLAADHLRSLLRRDDIVGIVYAGPPEALSGETEDLLRRAKVPLIVCYGDPYSARQLTSGGHVFQASPPYSWQARDLARYLAQDRGYRRVGVLTEAATHDGTVASRMAEGALRDYGIDRPVLAAYDDDVGPALAQLRNRQVEAIVVQGDPDSLAAIYEALGGLEARYRGTPSARVASAPPGVRRRRARSGWWHPQLAGFDLTINDRQVAPPAGTIATAPYARGLHYLPVPSFENFRRSFADWWGARPNGFEHRAYEATLALGWAAERAGGGDVARALEELRNRRFGGLPVTLGPDDHVTIEEVTIGLWTVPAPDDRVPERGRLPKSLPWVPLARGFSIDGETTDILSSDWRWLFRNPPPSGGPAPKFTRMRFGVTTRRSDPLR